MLSRFMFRLREVYLSDQSDGTSTTSSCPWSSIRFAANIVGNLGAPLSDGNSVDEWFVDGDEDHKPPAPVFCNDPFAVGLIKEGTFETM